MTGVPLGERESQVLELKGREALKNPKKIAEGVVALLNGDGGDLYIGVREEEAHAVAVEGISDAAIEAQKLHDSLLDRIDPRPGSDELRIEVVPDPKGTVIRIRVVAGAHPPYSASGKYFTRVGASGLSHQSLALCFGAVGPDPRRRDTGDAVASSRSGNAGDDPTPP